jgi:hypothetical protein
MKVKSGSAGQHTSDRGCGCKISSANQPRATATLLLLLGVARVVRRRRSAAQRADRPKIA